MLRQFITLTIIGALVTSTGCQILPPTTYLAEISPDKQKLGYVKEYYISLLHPGSSVYPQYSLTIRRQGQDQELLRLRTKELRIEFAAIAWTNDSKVVGFFLNCSEPAFRSVKKAYEVSTGKEVPFRRVETIMREQISTQWQAHIPPGLDPMNPESQPRVGLTDAF